MHIALRNDEFKHAHSPRVSVTPHFRKPRSRVFPSVYLKRNTLRIRTLFVFTNIGRYTGINQPAETLAFIWKWIVRINYRSEKSRIVHRELLNYVMPARTKSGNISLFSRPPPWEYFYDLCMFFYLPRPFFPAFIIHDLFVYKSSVYHQSFTPRKYIYEIYTVYIHGRIIRVGLTVPSFQ